MKKYASGLAVAALLTGCGGGGSDVGAIGSTTTTLPTTTTVEAPGAASSSTDAFVGKVREVVNASSEDARPIAIDSIAVTMPEDTKPGPIS